MYKRCRHDIKTQDFILNRSCFALPVVAHPVCQAASSQIFYSSSILPPHARTLCRIDVLLALGVSFTGGRFSSPLSLVSSLSTFSAFPTPDLAIGVSLGSALNTRFGSVDELYDEYAVYEGVARGLDMSEETRLPLPGAGVSREAYPEVELGSTLISPFWLDTRGVDPATPLTAKRRFI